MHVRWNYPPCIQRCNKEYLPFNTTLVLRGFIPGFSVTVSGARTGTLVCPEDFRRWDPSGGRRRRPKGGEDNRE